MWGLADGHLADRHAQTVEEGQSIEFKESLGRGARQEGIQSLVAFANSEGGSVFFGVRNNGLVNGVQVGKRSLEDLANEIAAHTYPSLFPFIETLTVDDKEVVRVETPGDVPPVVGVYLYCSRRLSVDNAVDAESLQAYRRVGRTNQKDDFMRMRRPQPTDPKLRLVVSTQKSLMDALSLNAKVWVENGTGTAHAVRLRMYPPLLAATSRIDDLPFPDTFRTVPSEDKPLWRLGGALPEHQYYMRNVGFVGLQGGMRALRVRSARIIAEYKDDSDITWESSRLIHFQKVKQPRRSPTLIEALDGGEFRRRIIQFPPKAQY